MSKKIPKNALSFIDPEQSVEVFSDEEDGPKKMKMTAYSGGVIKNHFYWGNLAISLDGLKFAQKKTPILAQHNIDRKIGFAEGLQKDNETGLTVNEDKTTFLETKDAQEFIDNSEKGFPYQASIYAKPSKIKRLGEGEEHEVNGYTLKGPDATVWLESELKEVSVVVFGYDSNTSSKVFADGEMEDLFIEDITTKKEQEEVTLSMDLKELKEKHPELVKQLSDEVSDQVKAKFEEKEEVATTKLTEMEEKVKEMGKTLLSYEKLEAKRVEMDRKNEADSIWGTKLSDSSIPTYLYDKVRKHVKFAEFVKEDKLDVESFSAAIDAEIKDWEKFELETKVKGGATSTERKAADSTKFDDDGAADTLLAIVGQLEK